MQFEKVFETYLKETNAYGNIYYSRYFEFAGALRESFYIESVCNNDPNKIQSYLFATKKASIEYFHDGIPFDKIKATLQTTNIRRASC